MEEFYYRLRRSLRRKNALRLVMTLVIVAGLPVAVLVSRNIVSFRSKAAVEPVQLYFSPATQTLPPASTFTVMADTKTNQIGFVRVKVLFDPTKVILNQEVSPSTLFKTVVEQTTMAEANTTGSITLVEALATSDTANPPTGILQLASLSFIPASSESNQTDVTIDTLDVQVVDMQSNILPTTVSNTTLTLNPVSLSPTSSAPSPIATATTAPLVSLTPTVTVFPVGSTVEAEFMSFTPPAVQVFNDPTASDGKGLEFFSNGTATGNFITDRSTTQLVVRASGDSCKGTAKIDISVDGVALKKSISVSSSNWSSYTVSLSKSAGTHPFSLSYANDFASNNCDRNLRIDSAWLQ